jgi:hypothetical protein
MSGPLGLGQVVFMISVRYLFSASVYVMAEFDHFYTFHR